MDEKSYRTLLDRQDWGDIHARLLDFALARCGKHGRAQAKDLAQSAIMRVYAYDSKWDPAKEPELLRYLMSVVNSLLANERTSYAARKNVTMHAGKGKRAAALAADEQAWGEKAAVEEDLVSRRLALLGERMQGDAPVLQYLECLARRTESTEAVRAATGWSLLTLKAVRRRMLRAAALVARDLGGTEEERSALTLADEDRERERGEEDEVELLP
jgi:hypothetical protein